MMDRFNLMTTGNGLFEITDMVVTLVEQSSVRDGIAVIWIPHSTSGVTVISKMDPVGFDDINDEINRLVPTRVDFKHQFDTPSDAAGHIKSAIIGVSCSVIIEQGKLQIGSSQGIYFFEFDGPRSRTVYLKLM